MKVLLIFCIVAVWAPWPAYADHCEGIENQLRSVSKQLLRGDIAGAERALAPLQASHSDCAALVLVQARIQAGRGEEVADETFVRYNSLKPKDPEGWAYLARYLLSQEEYQRADAASSLATDCDPSDPVAMAVQGQILSMKGETQSGIRFLEQAIQLNPDDAEARFQLGVIHDRARHPKQAVQYFTEDVKITPTDARAWDYLALNLELLGEVGRAQQAYKQALAVNLPGGYFDSFLPYNYGRFLMKLNQLAESKEQLDRAVELTPEVRAPWYERARLNVRLKNLRQARSDAEKAASIPDPQVAIADLQVFLLLGEIYSRLGETELAHKYAELGRVTPSPVQSEIDRTH